MSSINKICTIDKCSGLVNAKGLCNSHYMTLRRHGDATYPTKRHIYATRPYLKHISEYRTWSDMKSRCQNVFHHAYKDYGGRGITISSSWQTFEGFYKDMGNRPPGMSLDRKNNDKGYELSNCRWATKKQQRLNTRIAINNKSGFKGVFSDSKHPNRYRACITLDYINNYLGSFDNPELAALEYDKAVIFFRGEDGITNIL